MSAVEKSQFSDILPNVWKPNSYIGNEIHVIVKDPDKAKLSFLLAFPDLYELGMSFYGIQILYQILNEYPEVLVERVYAPRDDFESELRKKGVPLCSLENRLALHRFDIVGFSLQTELNYTNILNMLELGGIPLRSGERDDRYPLIIAGGPCTVNPHPMSDFIDAFLIGDGESAVRELVDLALQAGGVHPRDRFLKELNGVPGFYVPSFDSPEAGTYRLDARAMKPDEIHSRRIVNRLESDFLNGYTMEKPLLPLVSVIHDRLSVEVMRGCPHGCRFCQAGFISRPYREAHPEEVLKKVREGIDSTGWEEISLLSLSTTDYSCLPDLLPLLNRFLHRQRVSIALPSQRVDGFSPEQCETITQTRKTGITFAPEAGSERLRRILNKEFSNEQLFQALETAFQKGWRVVKLYFMYGLPFETEQDLREIGSVVREARRLCYRYRGKRINLTVSPFVPKPHTPFQWERTCPAEELREKRAILDRELAGRSIHSKVRDISITQIESILTRGDGKLGGMIEKAWRRGCRFDNWKDYFRYEKWKDAIEEEGIDTSLYLSVSPAETLFPWDNIDLGVRKEYLWQEKERAAQDILTAPCGADGCRRCGRCSDRVNPVVFTREHIALSSTAGGITSDEEITYGRRKRKLHEDRRSNFLRFRISYAKGEGLKYISHLDTVRLLSRTIRAADIPVVYSEGYNPHPRLSFGPPLPLGISSEVELFDIQTKPVSPTLVRSKLRACLPSHLELKSIRKISRNECSLVDWINSASYRIEFPDFTGDVNLLERRIGEILSSDRIPLKKGTDRASEEADIRPWIYRLELEKQNDVPLIHLLLRIGSGGNVSPFQILGILFPGSLPPRYTIIRTGLYHKEEDRLTCP
jgi:radical SAM family uncharacterized protein/radical SAM-linked protein